MEEIVGYILAGGASSRMGSDKAALRLGSETFVERIAAAVRSVTPAIFVVSSSRGPSAWGFPTVPDVHQMRGALGGLHAALAHSDSVWTVVVSCDLPFVTGELFDRMATLLSEEFDAIAPVQPDGRPQPLCAIYRTSTCLDVAEEMIQTGELRPRELLTKVRARWVRYGELSDLEDASLFFLNVNTPEEYESALKTARRMRMV